MATRINIVNRVVITIAILVQAVDGFGGEVAGIVGRDESAPFGGVISCIQIIQAGVSSIVIATRTKMIILATGTSVYLFYHLPRQQSRKVSQVR